MTILTLETCTDLASVGLVRDGVLLGEVSFPARHTLVSRLLARLDWLLGECGLSKGAIEALAVSLGPGTFTGVRIGATVGKVLASALGIPVVGVSTLEALARPFRSGTAATIVPVINARRGQVYAAAFAVGSGTLRRVSDDQALAAAPLASYCGAQVAPVILAGALAALPEELRAAFPGDAFMVEAQVSAVALAALAAERLARGEHDDPLTLAPVYLRPPADCGPPA
jgi:tRNA threonylcarbamoyladenosine biosynthesis protein TsaB